MPISYYLLLPVLGLASWMDWKERRIPNSVLFPSLILAFLVNLIILGPSGLLHSLSGTVVGFFLLIIPYLLRGMGAGDVKLLMVIGSFGGPYFVLYSFLAGAIIGGIIVLIIYIFNKRKQKEITSFPYGIPLSLGALVSLLLEYWRL